MDSVVLSALISAGGMAFTALGGMSLIRHRLTNVEKKLDIHNGYAKMFAEAHEDIAIMKNDISYLKDDVKEIKERGRK